MIPIEPAAYVRQIERAGARRREEGGRSSCDSMRRDDDAERHRRSDRPAQQRPSRRWTAGRRCRPLRRVEVEAAAAQARRGAVYVM